MILDNILSKLRYKQQIEIPRSDLVMLSLALLKEVETLEKDNSGAPGKVGIEFLLNQKYGLIDNKNINPYIRETLLKEIDGVINKVVAKYHIKRKGKNFYFDESFEIAITSPDTINPNPDANQLLANIYAAQVELESLRIQLTRTNLQNTSQTILIKQAVLDKELEIKEMKKKLRLFSYFDSVSDQDYLYRRSLGESKKEISTGALIGGAIGGKVASDKLKRATKFDTKQKKFQQTAKNLNQSKKEMSGMASELRHLHKRGLNSDRAEKKASKLLDSMKNTLKDQRRLKKAYQKGGKQLLSISKEALKKGAKGAAIGAAIGAAGIGIGSAINKAKQESLSNTLSSHLYRLEERTLDTFKDHKGVYQINTFRNRARDFLTHQASNRTTIAAALLAGGVGVSLLLRKAKEKGSGATIGSVKRAIKKALKSKKYTNTEKAKIQNNGKLAINKIEQLVKTDRRNK